MWCLLFARGVCCVYCLLSHELYVACVVAFRMGYVLRVLFAFHMGYVLRVVFAFCKRYVLCVVFAFHKA